MKRGNYSYNGNFFGKEQGRYPSQSGLALVKGGASVFWFYFDWGVRLGWWFPCVGRGFHSLTFPGSAKGAKARAFLSACPDVGQKLKGVRWSLKAVSSQISKMDSDTSLNLLLKCCQRLVGHICVDIFLVSLCCSIDPCVYSSANNTLSWLL